MKKTNRKKTWLLYVAMAVLMLASANVFAQFGGFFGTAHGAGEEAEREDNGLLGLRGSGVEVNSNGIGNQAFDVDPDPNYSPLGSGVTMLVLAGVGYALLKSKRTKKTLGMVVVALALLTGTTQCKKENANPNNNDEPALEGDTVHITLTMRNGSGSKSIVHPMDAPDMAPVEFELNDTIFVAYDGKWCGCLKCTASSGVYDQTGQPLGIFAGEITITQNGDQPLYFYYFGKKRPPQSVGSSSLTIDISDQSNGLPVISYAPSLQNYPTSNQQYTVQYDWLMNQCALVKFRFENIYDRSANTLDNNPYAIYQAYHGITLYGLENQVNIDLTNTEASGFSWSKIGTGAIKLFRQPGVTQDTARYAIIHQGNYFGGDAIHQGALEVDFDPSSDRYGFFGTYELQGHVEKNDYFWTNDRNDDGYSNPSDQPNVAELDLVWHSGAFSVSATKKVVFSRGNLQYVARGAADPNGTWRFAKHQYDFVGGLCEGTTDTYLGNVVCDETSASNNTKSDNTRVISLSNYSGWIDLFGWGTGNVPTEIRKDNLFYTGTSTTIYPKNGDYFHEWGAHNIVNSGTPGNTSWWTTLSKDDAVYLFETRSNANNKIGFGRIQVSNGLTETVNGLIILPDLFTLPASCSWNSVEEHAQYSLLGVLTGYSGIDFSNNEYAVAQWVDMEAAGAVFLPAAGHRDADGGTDTAPTSIEFDSGSGTYSENQDRGNYYWNDIQGFSAAWGLGFGFASGNDVIILGGNKVNANCGLAPNNGRSVRLVHRL